MFGEDQGRAAIVGTGYITNAPGTVLGYRRDGRPIFPIAGGDGTVDGGQERDAAGERRGPTLTHSQCINRLHDLRTQMSAIAELENPSEEDDRYFQELREEFDTVDQHRRRLERDATLAQVRDRTEGLSAAGYLRTERGAFDNAHRGRPGANGEGYDRDAILEPDSVEDMRFRNPWAFDEVRTFGRDPLAVAGEWHSRALSAVERMPAATDRVREAATGIIERWDDEDANLSRFVLALSQPAYLRGWSKIFRAGDGTASLTTEERQAIATVRHVARQTRALSLTDTAGGYLVPFQLDPTVILTANGSVNEIRQVARTVVAIGDTWHGVSAGAVQWQYQAEAAEVGDNSPSFAQPSIPIYKADGFVPISLEAIQDAANITAEVASLMAEGKDILESKTFSVTGTGTNMPTGIVPALAGSSSVVAAATDGTLAAADIYALHGSLPARYRRNGSWLGNALIYNLVRQFGQDNMWGTNMSEPQQALLLGRRTLEAEEMDGVLDASADNDCLIFGDFQNYVIADRIGMTMEFIPHLFGTANNRPTGQRGWLAYVRHGADSVNDAAFRMLRV